MRWRGLHDPAHRRTGGRPEAILIHPAGVPLKIVANLRSLAAWAEHSTPEMREEILGVVTGAAKATEDPPVRAFFVAYRDLYGTRLDQADTKERHAVLEARVTQAELERDHFDKRLEP